MDINLNLKLLENARTCNNDCKEKLDDGSLHGLTNLSSFACVGCGRACHMECHKVPKSLYEAIKKIPMNNRVNSFFGEFSYMRLVCENCANWLMVDVKAGETPSFLLLFSKLVDKIVKEKYVLRNDNEMMVDNSQPVKAGLNLRANAKRKKVSENDVEETGLLDEMKKMVASCLQRIENMDMKIDKNHKDIDSGISSINNTTIDNMRSFTASFAAVGTCFSELSGKISDVNNKIDSKHGEMENGLQEGFNNLLNKTEKLLSPMTPKRNGNGRNFSIRQQAIVNSARKFSAAPRMSRYSDVLKNATTSQGSSSESDIFGTIIPRRLFNSSNDNGPKAFKHKRAIHLRYVDPLITPSKILKIMTKNGEVDNAVKNDINCIEINRLTKKYLNDEEIRALKYGVSYRIGADDSIFDVVKNGSLFAPHWEIREWIDGDKSLNNNSNNSRNGQGNANTSLLQYSSDFLREDNKMIVID